MISMRAEATMNLVVLTGAGVSAESGVPTFRGLDGLWEGHRIEDVASPKGFARDPQLVHQFYNGRRAVLTGGGIHPNAAHIALAKLGRVRGVRLTLVTQNIDDLHERAGSRALIHMHGELLKAVCTATGRVCDWTDDLDAYHDSPFSPDGWLRPHIV